MSLSFFLAHRIYRDRDAGKDVSRPAVLIAMAGIAIGLAVMMIAVFVILGFKREVRDKIVGFGSHICMTNLDAVYSSKATPIIVTDSLLDFLTRDPDVVHIQRYSVKPGMIKTSETFQGMILKGVAKDYDMDFFHRHLVAGEIPTFSDSVPSNSVLISKSLSDKLKLKLGDKIDTYFIEGEIRARRLVIAGIYQTNFSEYDNLYLLTDLYLVNRLNQWGKDQVSGMELRVRDYDRLEEVTFQLGSELEGKTDRTGAHYGVENVQQLNPQIFAWLDILDVNIWVILVLMIGVAGFAMVSGLLILIIERTAMIGILKSLGANNRMIQRMFLWFAVFLIGKGLLWGNVLGLTFYWLQAYLSIFKLNPETYYMDTVPVAFNIWWFLLLNVGTLLVSILMLLGPSCMIARIHPADSMRYE